MIRRNEIEKTKEIKDSMKKIQRRLKKQSPIYIVNTKEIPNGMRTKI